MQARTAIGEKYYLSDFRYRALTDVLDAHAPPGYIGNSDLGTDIDESDAVGNSYDRAAESHVTSGTVTENGLSDARLVGSYEVGTVVGSVVIHWRVAVGRTTLTWRAPVGIIHRPVHRSSHLCALTCR